MRTATITTLNPANGQVLSRYPTMETSEAFAALHSAATAQSDWASVLLIHVQAYPVVEYHRNSAVERVQASRGPLLLFRQATPLLFRSDERR